jgi:hypothetical protein
MYEILTGELSFMSFKSDMLSFQSLLKCEQTKKFCSGECSDDCEVQVFNYAHSDLPEQAAAT